MGNNLARQLIASHLVEGQMRPGEEIAREAVKVLNGIGESFEFEEAPIVRGGI